MVRDLSVGRWGEQRAVEIVGRSQKIRELLERVCKIASYDEPVLVMGDSGVGKELLAQAIFLLGPRSSESFVPVNCPQYQEGNLTVSELFGHCKGSFTGAVADRKGCFETAGRGVIFLDEIGDLHMSAQVMLLRSLSTNEFRPLGSDSTRTTHARVVAATNRSLNELAEEKQFRRELIFRLRYFLIEVPPLRDRDDDWLLLCDYFLDRLHASHGVKKRFSDASLRLLEGYPWPGNVRELQTVTTSGYAMSDGQEIEPKDFVSQLDHGDGAGEGRLEVIYRRLCRGDGDFWDLVQGPFLERELNRREVRSLVSKGLVEVDGSYRRLLDAWGVPGAGYQKFMDFLRHHRLKPRGYRSR